MVGNVNSKQEKIQEGAENEGFFLHACNDDYQND